MFVIGSDSPCSSRASTRDAWLTEQGVASCRRGYVTTSQDAAASTAPDEGAAFSGRCDRVKGRGNTAWNTAPSCTMTPHKIAAVERRKARVPQGTRAPFAKVPD